MSVILKFNLIFSLPTGVLGGILYLFVSIVRPCICMFSFHFVNGYMYGLINSIVACTVLPKVINTSTYSVYKICCYFSDDSIDGNIFSTGSKKYNFGRPRSLVVSL